MWTTTFRRWAFSAVSILLSICSKTELISSKARNTLEEERKNKRYHANYQKCIWTIGVVISAVKALYWTLLPGNVDSTYSFLFFGVGSLLDYLKSNWSVVRQKKHRQHSSTSYCGLEGECLTFSPFAQKKPLTLARNYYAAYESPCPGLARSASFLGLTTISVAQRLSLSHSWP